MALDVTSLWRAELAAFERDGCVIIRGLFSRAEIDELMGALAALYARGAVPDCFEAVPANEAGDPLDVYPRMMHPHRVSETAMRYMLHPKLAPILRALIGEEPIAAQSMFYWKPPSGRGQALHQDNYYLRSAPGNCLAAWLAIDQADRDNGGLFMVPGSHKLPLYCPEQADLNLSFAGELVPVPQGLRQVPADLDPGDVLFFGGNVIHGSEPNRTPDRFRRSYICHYVGATTDEVSWFYKPLFRFDGSAVFVPDATGGGPCGEVQAAAPH